MIRAALLVLALALTGSARGDVWRHAIAEGSPDTQQDIYDSEMKTGDELTLQATSAGVSAANAGHLVRHAVQSYRNAASAKPELAEPYYKVGRVLYSFFFEPCNERQVYMQHPSPLCPHDPKAFDAVHAREIIDAWNAFEARAPLDPRMSIDRETSAAVAFNLLFHRAVLETQLASPDDLAAAIKDYERILARSDVADETVLSNLAEAYMMLGRLDDAIDTYRQALRTSRSTETMYGLAVALDRDERTDQAHDVINAQGEQAMAEFHRRVAEHVTFFVPEGEEAYYFALAYEAFGRTDSAIEYWKKFIVSKAAAVHPAFKQRAHEHLDPLLHDRTRKSVHLETPWRDFIR
ncbi:MAG: tetratricopeptide repeat protein [Kofleriaceae bacterium]